MNDVKVSIIIPVYNPGELLNRCLDSASNQTLKDIEIICVDDGSTNESGKILDEYDLNITSKAYKHFCLKKNSNVMNQNKIIFDYKRK